MKILILCDMFPPAFGPRMGYLCKYMRRAGWEPVVVTEQIDDSTFSFLKGETPVTYVNFFHSKGKILQKLEWICIFILDYFFHYKDKKMAKAASRLLEEGEYAGILCSSYRTFPLPAAPIYSREISSAVSNRPSRHSRTICFQRIYRS